jgi:hypothetical protein
MMYTGSFCAEFDALSNEPTSKESEHKNGCFRPKHQIYVFTPEVKFIHTKLKF